VVVSYQREMRRAWCWIALVVLAQLAAPGKCLARAPTRLVYARAPSAAECPDEPALTAAVAARLGYDPFSPWGDQTILATISTSNGGLLGQAQLIDHDGIAQGSREVRAPGGDCGELILSLALAISITLDPLQVNAPAGPDPDAEPAPPVDVEVAVVSDANAVSPAAEPATAPKPPVTDAALAPSFRAPVSSTWRGQASAFGAFALAPDVSFGGRLGLEARWRRWSLALEAWAALPATSEVPGGGAIESSLLAAAVVPCFEVLPHTRLCALGSLGSLSTAGREIDSPRAERVLHATAGGRASVTWALGNRLELLASIDLAASLNRPSFQLDRREVWRPGPLLTVLGLGASVRFF
jgi:hypothetical protein